MTKTSKLDKQIIALALELYFNQHGRDKYLDLVANLKSKEESSKKQADKIFAQFIEKNSDYLTREISLDKVAEITPND